MLAELTLRLKAEEEINYKNSSLFQGVLMERVDPNYAEKLHVTGLHPYSQCITSDKGGIVVWKIRTLDDEAYKGIIEPWLSPDIKSIKLEKKDLVLNITERSLSTCDNEDLLKEFYSDKTDRRIRVCFESPTAFKSDSKYVFMPDVSLIFGSLMRKYSSSSAEMEMTDQETLEYIVNHTYISSYRIRSTIFPLEGVNIPGFVGHITFSFNGTDVMARYVRLLLEFGEYSGVGIKAGIGMGAIRLLRGGKNER